MSDDDGVFIGEVEIPATSVDFKTVIMIAMLQCNKLLGRINDVPPGLHSMSVDLDVNDLKPNRINYVCSVDALQITLNHYLDEPSKIKDDLEALDKEEGLDVVEKAKKRHQILILLMAKENLLPLQNL